MEKSTIIYQISETDNSNKLENIFKELQINYQKNDERFIIYIPDVVIAKPVITKHIYTRLDEFEPNPDNVNRSTLENDEYQTNSHRICTLCSMCISK